MGVTYAKKKEAIKVKFEVLKIRYRNAETGYTIFEAKFIEYPSSAYLPTSEIVLMGTFPSILVDDEFSGIGTWEKSDIYGFGFSLSSVTRIVPQTEKGIQEFLRRNAKGIGAKTAKRIVEKLGVNTISLIEKDWKLLLEIEGMGEKKAKLIHEKMVEHKKFEDIALYALTKGASYSTAIKIYEVFGDLSLMKVKENPYILCKIPKVTFMEADKLGKAEDFPFDYPERVKSGILYFLELNTKSRGNLYVDRDYLRAHIEKFLTELGAYKDGKDSGSISDSRFDIALKQLVEEDKIEIDNSKKGQKCIYLKSYYIIENQIVRHLKKLIEEPKPMIAQDTDIQEFIDKYESDSGLKLAKKQKDAVFMSLKSGMSILTGGPGTGKV